MIERNLTTVIGAIYSLELHDKKKYLKQYYNKDNILKVYIDMQTLPDIISDKYFLYLLQPSNSHLGYEIINIIKEIINPNFEGKEQLDKLRNLNYN